MNPYAIIGILLSWAALGSYAVWERGDAASWHEKYTALQSSYTQAFQKAKDDAAKQEATDLAQIKANAAQAESFATTRQVEAEVAKQTYQRKLAQLAGKPNLDLPHACANQPIPSELIP